MEMARVAAEARVFPLLAAFSVKYRLTRDGDGDATKRGIYRGSAEVPYEFQKGGNRMLIVTQPSGADG